MWNSSNERNIHCILLTQYKHIRAIRIDLNENCIFLMWAMIFCSKSQMGTRRESTGCRVSTWSIAPMTACGWASSSSLTGTGSSPINFAPSSMPARGYLQRPNLGQRLGGSHDLNLLRKLVFPDGAVPKCTQLALPTRDCLFKNPPVWSGDHA